MIVFERVRVTIERYDSVKVNTTFNGEFATNNKRDIYSINTKNIEMHLFARVVRAACHRVYVDVTRRVPGRDLAHRVKNIVFANVPIETLSKEQWEAYSSATRCHICEKLFASDTWIHDHCHFIGKYRDPAH